MNVPSVTYILDGICRPYKFPTLSLYTSIQIHWFRTQYGSSFAYTTSNTTHNMTVFRFYPSPRQLLLSECQTPMQNQNANGEGNWRMGRVNCKWNRMNIKRIMEKEQRNLTNVTAISNTRYTRYTLYKSTLAHLQQQFVFKPNKTRHSIIWIQPSWDPLKETVALSARKREKKKKREFFTH